MSGIIALCALVVVAVLVLPVFGPRVAAMTAVIGAVAIVLVCDLICIPRALARTAVTQREAALPISGMSCASCALTIETALRGLPGVSDATVNFAAEKALVHCAPEAVTLADMAHVIRDVGYEIGTEDVTLQIGGMSCALRVSSIETAVAALPGVASVRVTLATGAAVVGYHPGLAAPAQIRRTIRDLGYESAEKLEGVAYLTAS